MNFSLLLSTVFLVSWSISATDVSAKDEEFLQKLRENSVNTHKTLPDNKIKDLEEFKKLVTKGMDDALGEIKEEAYHKSVADFLESKLGKYSAMIAREKNRETFIADYMKFLFSPCLALDSIWSAASWRYHDNLKDEDLIQDVVADAEAKKFLELANVCSALVESSDSIIDKAIFYLKRQRTNPFWYLKLNGVRKT